MPAALPNVSMNWYKEHSFGEHEDPDIGAQRRHVGVKGCQLTNWGNDGYVLMSQRENNCGVATAATYVIPDMS